MGNSHLCRSTACSEPKPVYKTVLSNIFQVTLNQKGPEDTTVNQSSPGISPGHGNQQQSSSGQKIDEEKLQAHVKVHIKSLIDYLETNHNKLTECGNHIYNRICGSFHQEVHIVGLIVIIELLNESKKFTYDKNFVSKLMMMKSGTLTKNDRNDSEIDNFKTDRDNEPNSFTEYNNNLTDNILEFESSVIEVIIEMLEKRKSHFDKVSFKYTLRALLAYSKFHLGTVPADKMENIITTALEHINSYQNFNNKDDLELNSLLVETLSALTKTPPVIFKFKHKFIQYSFNTLKGLYESTNNSSIQEKTEEVKNTMTSSCLALFTDVCHTVFDLNEFGILITPVFSLLDNTKWSQEKLHKDLFISLFHSMKENTAVDQIEIFIIHRLVQYLNYKKDNNPMQLTSYKHNSEPEVKIRVINLLRNIFEEINKPFMSFLITDLITQCFMDNFEDPSYYNPGSQELKESITEAQKAFLDKIANSSKDIFQVANTIISEINKKSLKSGSNNTHIREYFEFLFLTLDYVHVMPSNFPIPREPLMTLTKLKHIPEYSKLSLKAIESLLSLRYGNELESPLKDAKKNLLTCYSDLVYTLFSSSLSEIKNLIEELKKVPGTNQDNLINYLRHCARVNAKLIERVDITYINIILPFCKKIIDITHIEGQNATVIGLLISFVIDIFTKLQTYWHIEGLEGKLQLLKQRLPKDSLLIFDADKTLSSQAISSLLEEFSHMSFIDSIHRNLEYEAFVSTITTYLMKVYPSYNLSNMNDDFDDLANTYSVSAFMSREEDSITDSNKTFVHEQSNNPNNASILNLQNSTSPYDKNLLRRDSLTNFTQYNPTGTPRNNSLRMDSAANMKSPNLNLNTSNYLMDESFEKAMLEAKRNKAKTQNISKILENKI